MSNLLMLKKKNQDLYFKNTTGNLIAKNSLFKTTCFSLSGVHAKLAVFEPFLVLFDLTNNLSGGMLFNSIFLPCYIESQNGRGWKGPL